MDYFVLWIMLVLVSLWISLMVFIWALRSGQFSDQERARSIPLRAERVAPAAHPGCPAGLEVPFLVVLAFLFLAVMGAVVLMALSP